MLEKVFPKIHSEGYKFLAIAIFITIFLYFLSTLLGSSRANYIYMGLLFF